jgi:hypothetical protein
MLEMKLKASERGNERSRLSDMGCKATKRKLKDSSRLILEKGRRSDFLLWHHVTPSCNTVA